MVTFEYLQIKSGKREFATLLFSALIFLIATPTPVFAACPAPLTEVPGTAGLFSYPACADSTGKVLGYGMNRPDGFVCSGIVLSSTQDSLSGGNPVCIDAQGNQISSPDPAVNRDPNAPIECNSIADIGVTCIWRWIGVGLASALIGITAWTLSVSGILFNFVLNFTIVDFASQIYEPISSGIETAWTALRDISNIIIVGMFVFVALSMILGIEQFGAKKFIARVLIIAILINFSLLFTKIIVDVSNFFAIQFYKAAHSNLAAAPSSIDGLINDNGNSGVAFTTFADKGIAGRFMELLGISTLGDTKNILLEITNKKQSGWVIILHGLFSSTLFLVVAVLLLYATFLLLARTILLIFLFVTSALAFASFLNPATQKYGWDKWWDALLKSAAFAPLLMIFLWISLIISSTFAPSGGTLGALLSDPSGENNVKALFGYLMVAGMLFASIKMASAFSSQISGFKIATGITATGLLGASRLSGLLARTGIGKPAYHISNAMRDAGWEKSWLGRGAIRGANTLATGTFDAATTKLGKKGVKSTGGALFGENWGKGGYEGVKKRQAEAAAKLAKTMMPSDKIIENIAKEAGEKVAKANAGAKTDLEAQRATEQSKHSGAAQAGQEKESGVRNSQAGERTLIHRAIEDERSRERMAEQELVTSKDRFDREMRDAEARIVSAVDEGVRGAARRELEEIERRRTDQFASLNDNLAQVRADVTSKVDERQRELRTLDERARLAGENHRKEIESQASTNLRTIKEKIDTLDKKVEQTIKETKEGYQKEIATQIVRSRPGTWFGILGSRQSDPAVKKLGGVIKDLKHHKDLSDLSHILKEHEGHAEPSTKGKPAEPKH